MRISLESGLPVVVSDQDQVYPASSAVPESNPAREAHVARLMFKRLKWWPSWTTAYGNPFIHGSFLSWFRDDPTYGRKAKVTFTAIGDAVIRDGMDDHGYMVGE